MTGVGALLALTLAQTLLQTPGGPAAPVEQVARFAIVVGNNRPETGRGEVLHYADDDAVATHRLLLEAGVDSVLLVTLDDDSRKLYPSVAARGAPRGKDLDDAFEHAAGKIRSAALRGFREGSRWGQDAIPSVLHGGRCARGADQHRLRAFDLVRSRQPRVGALPGRHLESRAALRAVGLLAMRRTPIAILVTTAR